MRHEVIKLTDEAIFPELIKLLESKGEPFYSKYYDRDFTFLAFGTNKWAQARGSRLKPSITDIDFIQKYGENTAPEPDKERELLEKFVAQLNSDYAATYNDYLEKFLSSIRKPAFELVTVDNAKVTDPEQIVWWISSSVSKGKASDMKNWGYRCWSSEQAALDYRLNNTSAIKLSDMRYVEGDGYFISERNAHNLVNERINGK